MKNAKTVTEFESAKVVYSTIFSRSLLHVFWQQQLLHKGSFACLLTAAAATQRHSFIYTVYIGDFSPPKRTIYGSSLKIGYLLVIL